MKRYSLVLFFLLLSRLVLAQPVSQPSSLPFATQPPPSEPTNNPMATEAQLCLQESNAPEARLVSCRSYLLLHPKGYWRQQVSAVLDALQKTLPSSSPSSSEDPYQYLRYPRKKGDRNLLVVSGRQTPNSQLGLQLGQYLSPRQQLALAIGGGPSGLRIGVVDRLYLTAKRISPMASLALSYSIGNTTAVEELNENGEPKVSQVTFGPALMAHASVGISLRSLRYLSASVEGGYSLLLNDQEVSNALNPAALTDGGFFVAAAAGITW
jgi:hypothetical protein